MPARARKRGLPGPGRRPPGLPAPSRGAPGTAVLGAQRPAAWSLARPHESAERGPGRPNETNEMRRCSPMDLLRHAALYTRRISRYLDIRFLLLNKILLDKFHHARRGFRNERLEMGNGKWEVGGDEEDKEEAEEEGSLACGMLPCWAVGSRGSRPGIVLMLPDPGSWSLTRPTMAKSEAGGETESSPNRR